MTGKSFVWRGIALLVLVLLLVAGGFALHYAGWSYGYAAGQVDPDGEGVSTPAYVPEGWAPVGYPMMYHHGFGLVGLVFKGLLLVLFLGLVFKLLRVVIFGGMFHAVMHGSRMAGPWAAHWRRHHRYAGHHWHGPVPPWWCEDPQGEPSEDAPSGDA